MNTALKSHQFYGKGLYDPVQTHIKTIPYINKIYGSVILEQLTNETLEARQLRRPNPQEAFSKDLINEMRTRLVRQFPDSGFETEKPINGDSVEALQSVIGFSIKQKSGEPAEQKESENGIQRKRQKGDDFFLMLERGLFRNPEFRKIFKGPFTVYGWFWSNIVREGWIDKKGYPIKKRYYDRGLLAYCSSFSKIAEECFMNKDTVKKYTDHLAANGILIIDPIIPEGKKRPQNVYILGEWGKIDGKIVERLYLYQVLLSAKDEDLWDF
ncbi:MAG: hypothetical protein K8S18_08115 [Desulfobacula sp.]|nr:hypothetical protein [Desulfobacula sp.]